MWWAVWVHMDSEADKANQLLGVRRFVGLECERDKRGCVGVR